ncbi:DNA processing protein DprA [Roseovarius sp. EC-HK134]|uniref:DNA-processing protein DprA n=1 Tax=unclassified Roseovarius TaxID=2614913 RepID=UPI0012591DFC|nr:MULTISPECIES: DNA-processing protein DprA [unclassified Roseovarius]VVT02490.1 DNA processing protein DprA [Roseovarius sp. EC-HK134]VVT03166.1 DNA processing protein DprA [Roseovarius sp. EC-SD190]
MPKLTHPSTHPPLPPTTEDDRVSWLRLLRSRRVGPATFHRLLAEHGSAQAALAALPEVARAAGVPDYTPCPPGVAEAELRAGHAVGARLLTLADPGFPTQLKDISDCPPLLWVMGDAALLARPMIALVGARNASSLGTRMARSLAADLSARGYLIVSGLARGVDTAAHLGSLEAGTIAVMAGGVDVIYPAENTKLAGDILASGLRLSEQPIGLIPQARHFPSRNRLVSGLAQAVVVVEAAAKSGSLITARTALDQGREVMAVPGHPIDARASGCNMLIRDGATLIRNAEDVIDALPQAASIATAPQTELPLPPTTTLRDIAGLHAQILNRLGPSPLAEDQLIRDLATPAHRVAPALLDLELDGRITRHPGGLLALAQ